MNSDRSNNVSLKYQRFTTLGSKDIGIIKSEFVAKLNSFSNVKPTFEDEGLNGILDHRRPPNLLTWYLEQPVLVNKTKL